MPGAEGRIAEVVIDPALDPKLWRWSRFWLDENLYAKVKSSLSEYMPSSRTSLTRPDLAQSMPGRDTKGFRMPESLFTVNTLISSMFPIGPQPTLAPTNTPCRLLQSLLPPATGPTSSVSTPYLSRCCLCSRAWRLHSNKDFLNRQRSATSRIGHDLHWCKRRSDPWV